MSLAKVGRSLVGAPQRERLCPVLSCPVLRHILGCQEEAWRSLEETWKRLGGAWGRPCRGARSHLESVPEAGGTERCFLLPLSCFSMLFHCFPLCFMFFIVFVIVFLRRLVFFMIFLVFPLVFHILARTKRTHK